jgi:hypothetical protein
MQWNLGSLEPNQTVKHTIAVMFGCKPVYYTPPTPVVLTKTDDIGTCVLPYDGETDSLINYTIHYDACGFSDTNVMLIDILPDEVDFNSASGSYDYNSDTNTVTWNIGTMGPNDTNSFHLQVKANSNALQGRVITNVCELTGDNFSKEATKDTNICCVDNKVYVDACAPAGGNGQSWQYAYNNLQTALENVRSGNHSCANQIWVAAGVYKPTNDANQTDETFAMLNGINIYGHFAGWETSIDQRNLADANNDTILSGDIDDNNTADVYYVVTAANSRIDGFTVRKSYSSGIYASDCSPTIANCVVKYNNYDGIYCTYDSNVTITNTFVNDNGNAGIYGYGTNEPRPSIYIDRCTISNNRSKGLNAFFCTANVLDSIFSGNGDDCISATLL